MADPQKPDDKTTQAPAAGSDQQPPTPTIVTPSEAAQARARQAARESAVADRDLPIDQAPAGGAYVVGDQLVDANGEPIKGRK
jgi:hypothetical protein